MTEASESIVIRRLAPDWTRALAAFALATALLGALYWRTFASLVWVWAHDGTFQYAFLILPLSAWTAYGLRHRLLASPPRPSLWGLIALGGLSIVWFLGHLVSVNVVQHFAVVATFPVLVLALWGTRAVRVLAFPLGYLVFAIPAGDSLVGPLQDFTARFAVKALEITGVPVLLDGREITTTTTTWMVGQACSGIKFFIASLALGCLFSYLMYRRWWKRLLFVALSAVVPIVANGLRVYFTVLIGDRFGLKYATGTDHMIFGWQFFGTVLLLLLLFGWWWRDPVPPAEGVAEAPARRSPARRWAWIAAAVLLAVGPTWSFLVNRSLPVPESLVFPAPHLTGWRGPAFANTTWHPHFAHADARVQAAYRRGPGDNPVELYSAVYQGAPRKGHDLLTYGNDLYSADAGNVLRSDTRRVHLPSGRTVTVQELQIGSQGGTRVIWSWYRIDGRVTLSPVLVKLEQAADILRGKSPRASVWAISSETTDGNLSGLYRNMSAFLSVFDSQTTDSPTRRDGVAQRESESP